MCVKHMWSDTYLHIYTSMAANARLWVQERMCACIHVLVYMLTCISVCLNAFVHVQMLSFDVHYQPKVQGMAPSIASWNCYFISCYFISTRSINWNPKLLSFSFSSQALRIKRPINKKQSVTDNNDDVCVFPQNIHPQTALALGK